MRMRPARPGGGPRPDHYNRCLVWRCRVWVWRQWPRGRPRVSFPCRTAQLRGGLKDLAEGLFQLGEQCGERPALERGQGGIGVALVQLRLRFQFQRARHIPQMQRSQIGRSPLEGVRRSRRDSQSWVRTAWRKRAASCAWFLAKLCRMEGYCCGDRPVWITVSSEKQGGRNAHDSASGTEGRAGLSACASGTR